MTSQDTVVSSAKRTLLWTLAVLLVSQLWYLVAVFCSISSQVTKMASFLLPIKVLYIAAAPNIPNYLAKFAPMLSREELVLSLSAMAILLFVFHVVFEWARNTLEQRQFALFFTELQKNRDTINQQRTRALYRHSLAFLSGIIFSILLIALLGFIAPELIALLLGLILVAALLVHFFDKSLQATWCNSPQTAPTAIGVICAIGFLSGFAIILQTLLNNEHASVVVAIVSLIAFRLLMNQIALISNAINYHGKSGFDIDGPLEDSAVTNKDEAKRQDPSNNLAEFEAALRENFEYLRNELFFIRQIDASAPGTESYLIQDPQKNIPFCFLTKSANAQIPRGNASGFDEFQLNSGLAPKTIAGSPNLRETWTAYKGPISDIPPDEHPKAKHDFLVRLAAVPIESIPEKVFTERLLYNKLCVSEIRKAIQKYDIDAAVLSEIEVLFERSRKLLQAHPMQLQLRTNQGSLVYDALGNPLAINWEQCNLVPAGTSFEGETLIFDPVEIIQSASKTRADLKDIPDAAISLAYETGRLAAALERGRYSSVAHITAKIASLTKAL